MTSLIGPARRAQRAAQPPGISRRTLLRRSLGIGVGLWVAELLGGTVSFLWSAGVRASAQVRVGTLRDVIDANPTLPVADGFPAPVGDAHAFVVLINPAVQEFMPGVDLKGDGRAVNVRALSQRCPHLGCRPNPCVEDFWFRCPCHQSRYDRLGIKAAGVLYGPAARGMDRFAVAVDQAGVLTIDTGHITLGPLPVALGQPGLIPPLVANGCV
jgi:cytochrome b6-f complex iron-sulfur subunit